MSSLSNLLRVGKKAEGLGSQRIETRRIDPAQFSQQSARWLLPTSGIMDNNGYICLSMTGANANQNLPLYAGINAVVATATLFDGNEIIAQTDYANHRTTLNSWFGDPSVRKQVNITRTGAMMDFMVADVSGQYSLDKKIVGLDYAAATGDLRINSAFRLGTTEADTPEWRLYLNQMFPFLKFLQLPVGLIDSQLALEIQFAPDLIGNRTVAKVAPNTWAQGNTILESKCELVVDLLYWEPLTPNEPSVMEQLQAEMDKGLSLTFEDTIAFETQIPDVSGQVVNGQALTRTLTVQSGFAGQVLRRLLIATPKQPVFSSVPGDQKAGNQICGNYFSQSSQGNTELQVFINAIPVFSRPLNSDNKIYSELSQVWGKTDGTPMYLKANCGMTSWNGQVFDTGVNKYNKNINQDFGSATTFETHSQKLLDSTAAYLGVPLMLNYDGSVKGNGVVVNNQPVKIQLTRDRTIEQKEAYSVICFGDVERHMKILGRKLYVSGSS